MGTLCSHKPSSVKATDFLISNHLDWSKHDSATGEKHTVLATALVGFREFYAAVEHVKVDGARGVWCAVLKVSWHPGDHYNCCVKSMSEHDDPYFHRCPEKILKLLTPLPDSESNAKEWREKCWANINHKKAVKKTGDLIRFWGFTYELGEDLGRRGFRVRDVNTGQEYRMKLHQVKQAALITEE